MPGLHQVGQPHDFSFLHLHRKLRFIVKLRITFVLIQGFFIPFTDFPQQDRQFAPTFPFCRLYGSIGAVRLSPEAHTVSLHHTCSHQPDIRAPVPHHLFIHIAAIGYIPFLHSCRLLSSLPLVYYIFPALSTNHFWHSSRKKLHSSSLQRAASAVLILQ